MNLFYSHLTIQHASWSSLQRFNLSNPFHNPPQKKKQTKKIRPWIRAWLTRVRAHDGEPCLMVSRNSSTARFAQKWSTKLIKAILDWMRAGPSKHPRKITTHPSRTQSIQMIPVPGKSHQTWILGFIICWGYTWFLNTCNVWQIWLQDPGVHQLSRKQIFASSETPKK